MDKDVLKLSLRGPARLEHQGQPLKIQRKSLALLYYLALEGMSRREKIAELLWGGPSSANSLRVELSKLRANLRQLGVEAFDSENPLQLPSMIQLVQGSSKGEFLEGLDDLNSDYQIWLEAQRIKLENQQKPAIRKKLIEKTASTMSKPYLIFLRGQPASGRFEFAQRLAAHLDLPLIEGASGQSRALRYFREPISMSAELVKHILDDEDNVWVLECSAFGEDSSAVLRLRELYPPEQTQYIDLPPLSWSEARSYLLNNLSFSEAARLYHASGGYLTFLEELLQLRPPEGYLGALPVLRRIQARYKLETRYLSREARYSLEKLSVHPGTLGNELLQTFGALEHLDELERRGWLSFDESWHFVNEMVRQLLYQGLKPGQKQRYHREAASLFALSGNITALAYHSFMLNESFDWSLLLRQSEGWKQLSLESKLGKSLPEEKPLQKSVVLGESQPLFESQYFGEGIEWEEGGVSFVRHAGQIRESGMEWHLPDRASILQLSGRIYFRNTLLIGLSGEALPLRLELYGNERHSIYFADVRQACYYENSLVLPLTETINYHFYVPHCSHVSLESRAETAVMELKLSAFALLENKQLDKQKHEDPKRVNAYQLGYQGKPRPLMLERLKQHHHDFEIQRN
ncbi:MAG: hypothetical protein R2865_08070 [Deinococcales bacterium]